MLYQFWLVGGPSYTFWDMGILWIHPALPLPALDYYLVPQYHCKRHNRKFDPKLSSLPFHLLAVPPYLSPSTSSDLLALRRAGSSGHGQTQH